jgi:hypothetical protein
MSQSATINTHHAIPFGIVTARRHRRPTLHAMRPLHAIAGDLALFLFFLSIAFVLLAHV